MTPRRVEQVALVGGFLVVVLFVATFDWRLAGIMAGIGILLSAIDLSAFIPRRR